MKGFLISVWVVLACLVMGGWAAEPVEPDWLAAGRRMVPVRTPLAAKELSGRAPQGEGAPFRVLCGSEVLWEGPAGAEFRVKIPPGVRWVYLMSAGERNLQWSDLAWKRGKQISPAKGFKYFKTERVYDVAEAGIAPGEADAGPALRRLISRVRSESVEQVDKDVSSKGTRIRRSRIVFPKGVYHFYPQGALPMSFYVSNHDQQDISPVGIPLVDLDGVTLDGSGSTFVFHGKMQPFLLRHCNLVQVKNVTIAYAAPYYVEGEITAIANGMTTLRFSPLFRWKVENGRFRILYEGGESTPRAVLGFEKNGPMVPTSDGGDKGWTDQAEQVDESEVRFKANAAKHGFEVGHVLVLRSFERPHPAMVLYNAGDVTLDNVIFRDSQGMALLAQRSGNITIRGGGCITGKGRVYTVSADATHFSNCRGKVLVENAMYEGMMDDAINVHSTCLAIEKVESATQIIARFVHRQSVGFEVFRPGEKVQFIKCKTLENHPSLGKTKTVERLDETHLRITLESPLPEGVGQGDAVENADWYPSVIFRNNTVRYNRARGCLFTTPKKVLVEGNKFIRSHGSAILLAGDAQGWYESGACRDVTIRNNFFDHNLTASYQFCEAVISIYPEVRRLDLQVEPYHRHITIENNTFLTHHVPLLYVRSADDIIWRNNKVSYDDKFPARNGGKPFIYNGPAPKKSQIPLKP